MRCKAEVLDIKDDRAAILINQSPETIYLPLCVLPRDIREGDILNIQISFLPYDTIRKLDDLKENT